MPASLTVSTTRRIDYVLASRGFFEKYVKPLARAMGIDDDGKADDSGIVVGRTESSGPTGITSRGEDLRGNPAEIAEIIITNQAMSDHAAVSLRFLDPPKLNGEFAPSKQAARFWKELKPAGRSLFSMGFGSSSNGKPAPTSASASKPSSDAPTLGSGGAGAAGSRAPAKTRSVLAATKRKAPSAPSGPMAKFLQRTDEAKKKRLA